jgi:hypothetical protein
VAGLCHIVPPFRRLSADYSQQFFGNYLSIGHYIPLWGEGGGSVTDLPGACGSVRTWFFSWAGRMAVHLRQGKDDRVNSQ